MAETFAQYLEKWLKLATAQGLNNPLVKMPVKRFRLLQPHEFNAVANGGSWIIGTMSDPIARNLHKNFQTYIRERGEHCAFVCSGSVEMTIAAGVGQQPRTTLFPVSLKRATLHTSGEQIRTTVSEDEIWQFNPVLRAHLKGFGVHIPDAIAENPAQATGWLRAQLGNRASQVKSGRTFQRSGARAFNQERWRTAIERCHYAVTKRVDRRVITESGGLGNDKCSKPRIPMPQVSTARFGVQRTSTNLWHQQRTFQETK